MRPLTNDEIFQAWDGKPAPFLGLLHAFHSRDRHLSREALEAISERLSIPIAELFGTATFYHHLSRDEGGLDRPRVCVGPLCAQAGADLVFRGLKASGQEPIKMPCPGRCDAPTPVIWRDEVFTASTEGELAAGPSPPPPSPPEGTRECVFEHIRSPGRAGIEGYVRTEGYAALRQALEMEDGPGGVVQVVADSGLAGRGGAGFPTGLKWRAVREAQGDAKAVVCNADEGEPGCFKDRALMDYDPHAVLEGMAIAGLAAGAELGIIYLRYEYPATAAILESAIGEAEAQGLLGTNILGSGLNFTLHVRRGAGAYICGEESSLLNSLEGLHPFPRNRPPFPTTRGYLGRPTIVNNVETLASVPPIIRRGADWYRGLGLGEHAGTKVISLSGDVQRPGNYEVPIGLPLLALLEDWAGGPLTGRAFQACTMAGLSGGFLGAKDFDATLDEPSIRAKGSFLGAGGIMVLDDSRDLLAATRDAMAFFAEESCGKCFPCRIGTRRLVERLEGGGPRDLGEWIEEVEDLGDAMKKTSACGLGQAAPLLTDSLLRIAPDRVRDHVRQMEAGGGTPE